MGPIKATASALSKAFNWTGRASRSEYWWFYVSGLAIQAAAGYALLMPAIEPALGAFLAGDEALAIALRPRFSDPVFAAYWAIAIWIGLAQWSAMVRRLHDIGLSGWWQLVVLVPIIGPLALLVMMILPSKAADNRWGPPPGGTAADAFAAADPASAWTQVPKAGKKRPPMTAADLRAMRHSRMGSAWG